MARVLSGSPSKNILLRSAQFVEEIGPILTVPTLRIKVLFVVFSHFCKLDEQILFRYMYDMHTYEQISSLER